LLDGGYAICVDKDNSVYVFGQTHKSQTSYNYILIKYQQY